MEPFDLDKFALNIKNEQREDQKVSHKFSIESILGLSSQQSLSHDAAKINRLELMDFSQKGNLKKDHIR